MNKKKQLEILEKMMTIRFLEEKIEFGISRGHIQGTTHLCIGQEAIAVGVSEYLTDKDYVVSNHRGHGHALAKGLSVDRLLSEIMGKENGYCNGRGGTQHISYMKKGFIGTNGITAGGMPLSLGAAFSIKYLQKKNISVVFLGDGATNQGVFHETLNMASIWSLPILFICENNKYGMSNPVEKSISKLPITHRSRAHNIKSFILNGMDVLQICEKMENIITAMKKHPEPIFIEFKTYRYKGHSKSDPKIYRSKEEENIWEAQCPIKMLKKTLLKNTNPNELEELSKKTIQKVNVAYQKALDSPFPSPTEIKRNLYEH